jgi:glycosyltransferase involved in cell wall biosynthesis
MNCYKKILFSIVIFMSACVRVHSMPTLEQVVAHVLYDPLLVVILMVKNEETVINATLEPYIKAGINDFLIFDTGSTDKTITTVEQYLAEQKVKNAYVMQEPFIDFATSRNRALELAEERFPHAAFFLFIDAEWYMINVEGLIDFCKAHLYDYTPSYVIQVRMAWAGRSSNAFRLSRADSRARFFGVVHEVLLPQSGKKVPNDIYFEYKPAENGSKTTQQRWLRDRDLLLKKFTETSDDSRTAFYLAQTYECLGELHNAYTIYRYRSQLPGWDEENYETFYRLGRITNVLSKTDENFTWDMAFNYFCTAFKIRPHRAEPLIEIAEHYWPDNIPLCFLFAKRALDLPYPENETLFVNNIIYDYCRYEVISKSAWTVGEYELGEYATREALKVYPDFPHLRRNLECYLQKNAEIAGNG